MCHDALVRKTSKLGSHNSCYPTYLHIKFLMEVGTSD